MVRILKLLLVSLLFFKVSISYPQVADPFYQQIINQVSYDTILANLQHLESLGRKEPGTADIDNTADWLIAKYQSYGYTNIVRDTFLYNGNQLYNLVVTKSGTTFPPQYLIMDGHYDTYHGPGVNDNGSGVAVILEVARLLSGIPTGQTIKFINFSAEEQGLIGSQHYVDHTLVPSNMDIMLVFNIDEVGGVAGMVNNTITCERDETNPTANNATSWAYTDTLVNLTHLYSNLQTQINYAYGSDYVPFQEAGKVITGFYETNESPYVHSENDILANMSPLYVTQVAKAATGAALHFSKAIQLNTGHGNDWQQESIAIYPNPASQFFRFNLPSGSDSCTLSIFDASGKFLAEKVYSSVDDCRADISSFKPGLLALRFALNGENANSQVIKIIKK